MLEFWYYSRLYRTCRASVSLEMVVPSTLLACEDHAMLHKAASTSPDRVDLSCSEAPIIRGVVCSPFLDPHQQRYYAVAPALYRK